MALIDEVKEGNKIRALIIGRTNNHILKCNDGFCFDLSEVVTVRRNKDGVLYAGQLSLSSYANSIIEIIK